jgi:hypothetical protein
MVVQPPERAVQQTRQFLRGAIHCLLQRRGVLRYCHRLPAFQTGLEYAALVLLPALVAVLVAQMNFHSGDVCAETLQRLLDGGAHLCGQRLGTIVWMSVLSWIFIGTSLGIWGVRVSDESSPPRRFE